MQDDFCVVAESAQPLQPARDIVLDRAPELFRRVIWVVPEHLDDQGRSKDIGRRCRNLVIYQPTRRADVLDKALPIRNL